MSNPYHFLTVLPDAVFVPRGYKGEGFTIDFRGIDTHEGGLLWAYHLSGSSGITKEHLAEFLDFAVTRLAKGPVVEFKNCSLSEPQKAAG